MTTEFNKNFLGQTAGWRCENSPSFQGLTLSPSSGCYW